MPDDALSPTQPFPVRPPPLVPHTLGPADDAGHARRAGERGRLELGRYRGAPAAPDRRRQRHEPRFPGAARPARRARRDREEEGAELAPQEGTPYGLWREPLLSPLGIPCAKPPWGTLAAVDLAKGEILWQRPLGTIADPLGVRIHWEVGTPNLGGPLVTAGGLVFVGAALDDYLRAFDLESGAELWRGRLPAGGQATPMSYETEGRQFVLIAAGGHERMGKPIGDTIVAFALPR